MDSEIYVSDEELRQFVNEIFAKEYRSSSYQILLDAKKNKKAKVAYFNFINAYILMKNLEIIVLFVVLRWILHKYF